MSFLRNYVKKKAEKAKEESLQACIEKENRAEKNNKKSNQPVSKANLREKHILVYFFLMFQHSNSI